MQFLLPTLKPSAFLLWLNNLSLFGFLLNAWTRIGTYVWFFFFGREYHDFVVCFDARTALSLFTVNNLCQLPSVNYDTSLHSSVTHT